MKTNTSPKALRSATLALVAAMGALPAAYAASGTWNGTVSGNWTASANWISANVPNAASEIATFSGNRTVGQTITVDAPITVGQILASSALSAPAGLTITGGNITLANGVNQPIISTGSVIGFDESAAKRLKISSALDGTNGFERQGSGWLDLSGVTNIFTGTIKLTAPSAGGGSFTVINSDANLGNSANVITVALNSQAVGFYNDAAAGSFTLNSARTITTSGSGDFWVKNKLGANMTIAGVISGSARLRKNDTGILTLSNVNTYTGGTFIEGGTLVLTGGNNRILSNSTVTFGSGTTLDVGATSQTVSSIVGSGTGTVTGSYTVNGVGGKLLVNGDVQYTVGGANGTLVNMAGLTEFEYNRATKNFLVQPNSTSAAATTEIRLAANGIGKNTITAAAVTVGTATTGNGADNLGTMRLGTDNTINSGTIQIGGFNGRGTINFNTGLTNPTLKLRGVDGTSAMTNLNLGLTSSGTRLGTGILDLTGGSLDALVTNLTIGNNTTGLTDNSTLTMPAGTVVVTNLKIGTISGTGAAASGVLNNAFNQGGGTVTATTLTFGENTNTNVTPQTPTFNASYNLAGGTLRAGTIQAGSGTFNTASVRQIGWTNGTISNLDASTDLNVNGLAGTGGSIILAMSTAGNKAFDVGTGRTITLGANTTLSGASVGFTKSGAGTLALNGTNSYTGLTNITGGALTIGSGSSLVSGNDLTLGSSGTANFANASQTLGAVINDNPAANALNFSAGSGTVTLASLSGAGSTTFGSNGIVTGGISSGTVTSVGNLTASLSGGTTTVGGVATIATMSAGTANLNGATSSITTLNGGTINLGNTTLTVVSGSSSGSITGTNGSLVKATGGNLTLSGSNTYGGGTIVNGGTLVAANNSAFGSGNVTVNTGGTLSVNSGITIANPIILAGGAYASVLTGSYTGFAPLTSNIPDTTPNTTASILAGTVSSGGTLSASFSGTSAATNDSLRISDVLSFSGTGTDIFVLQIAVAGVAADKYLGWLNLSNTWVNAVSGNIGSVGGSALQNYAGSFASSGALANAAYLGSFGYDTAGGNVWAVIDHNSDFTVIPEPSTYAAMVGLGAVGLALYRRRRRQSVKAA